MENVSTDVTEHKVQIKLTSGFSCEMCFVCHARWRRKLTSKKSAVNCQRNWTIAQPTVFLQLKIVSIALLKISYWNLAKLISGCGSKMHVIMVCACGNFPTWVLFACVCVRRKHSNNKAHRHVPRQCCHVDQSTAHPTVTCVSIATHTHEYTNKRSKCKRKPRRF